MSRLRMTNVLAVSLLRAGFEAPPGTTGTITLTVTDRSGVTATTTQVFP